MRILFIDTTTDSSEIGGGHLILPELMRALILRGHDVHLVMAASANEKLSQLIIECKAIVHIAPWKKRLPVSELATIFNDWINEIKPDVYVISSSAAIGWLVLPLLNPQIPAFAIGHNNEETFYMPVRHYNRFLTRAVGVSEEICQVYKKSCEMPDDKVKWIPYGVPSASSICGPDPQGALRIIYVGRIEEYQKRISDVTSIALKLRSLGIKFQLTIVGDGPEMNFVKTELNDLINNGEVLLTGWKTKSEIIQMLRRSDVFILTSAFEGFSIALTEAMANGCCPVVSDIRSGNQQLVRNGDNGFLIPVGDIEAYLSVLSSLANSPALLRDLRNKALLSGIQFSVERMALSYEKEFLLSMEEVKEHPRVNDTLFPLLPTCISKYPLWIRKLKSRFLSKQIVNFL